MLIPSLCVDRLLLFLIVTFMGWGWGWGWGDSKSLLNQGVITLDYLTLDSVRFALCVLITYSYIV